MKKSNPDFGRRGNVALRVMMSRLVAHWWVLQLTDFDNLPEIEVPESSPIGPVWRTDPSDQTWGARPTTEAELRAWAVQARNAELRAVVRIRPRRGHIGRAPRRACNLHVRSRRDTAGSRAPPSGDDDPGGEGEDDDHLLHHLVEDDHQLVGGRR